MNDREVLEWWDYAVLSRGDLHRFVFGPVQDLYDLEMILNPAPRRA